MTIHHFSRSTQFNLEGQSIKLYQGQDYIAQGTFSEWIHCLEGCYQQSETTIKQSHIQVINQAPDALLIYDATQSHPQQLSIPKASLAFLEERLEELHQGCCEPLPFNIVADICDRPHEVLELLQEMTQYPLSSEQILIAIKSLDNWPRELEIATSDLTKMWIKEPQLKFFAKVLKFYFWAS